MRTGVDQKGGFTLVELSIVLVIIGLLIGGILVGQSMITTAKITAVASQIQQFDAGVMTFKAKYNSLPGDSPGFGGNGNRAIEGGYSDYPSPWPSSSGVFGRELANFWPSINQDNFGPIVPNAAPAFQASSAPTVKVGKTTSYLLASDITSDGWYADLTNIENYYFVITANQVTNGGAQPFYYFQVTSSAALRAIDLQTLDIKIDDGIANTGGVLSGSLKNSGMWVNAGIYKSPLPNCSSGATYDLTKQTYECTPLIRIGAQTGDPQ